MHDTMTTTEPTEAKNRKSSIPSFRVPGVSGVVLHFGAFGRFLGRIPIPAQFS